MGRQVTMGRETSVPANRRAPWGRRAPGATAASGGRFNSNKRSATASAWPWSWVAAELRRCGPEHRPSPPAPARAGRVERDQRFVHQDKTRRDRQGARHGRPPLHAERGFLGVEIGRRRQTDGVQQGAGAPRRARRIGDVLGERPPRQQTGDLKTIAKAPGGRVI